MNRRRGWLKHSNDASRGESLAALAREKQYLSICLFWLFMELANSQDDDGEGDVRLDYLCTLYNIKRKSLVRSLDILTEFIMDFEYKLVGQNELQTSYKPVCNQFSTRQNKLQTGFGKSTNGFVIRFKFANYLKYQGSGSKKPQKPTRKIKDIKDKIKNNKKSNEKNLDSKKVFELWNSTCSPLPKMLVLNDQRRRAIQVLSNNHSFQLPEFKALFEKAKASDFLAGKNDRGWRADFDFVLRRWAKILEGAYDFGNVKKMDSTKEKDLFR